MGPIEALEERVLYARSDTVIDSGWRFVKSDVASARAIALDDSAWEKVTLPHTWNASDGQDGGTNYYRGPGWYRRHLQLDGSQAGKRIFLKFDGASTVADLYVNGTKVGQHKGGFSGFTFDVTPYVSVDADNVIAVKVNNAHRTDVAPLQGDFNVNGGIYRDVHLITTDPVHINLLDLGSPGVFLKQTKVSRLSAELAITTELRNDAKTARKVTVLATLRDHKNKLVKSLLGSVTIAGRTTRTIVQNMHVASPRLWNGVINPYLYKVHVQVTDIRGSVDDSYHTVGFRSFAVSPSSGFWLNGKTYDLHGVNFHQDRIDKGWAISDADTSDDLALVKEIGATAVRLAHYQHSQTTFDWLDRNGVVAWAEIPLLNMVKDTAAFADNARQQLRELIRQNYNHPSIVFWGIFNELADTPGANALATNLGNIVWEEDPTRASVSASNLADQSPLNWRTDYTAFNKYFGWYYGTADDIGAWADNIHLANPNKKIALSEYGAGGSVNQHESPTWQPYHGGPWHPEEYQAQFHEAYWNALKSRPYLWAKFVWSMFDFASDSRNEGDAKGRNDKGLVTYDRKTRKDAFYWYKANWSSQPFNYITSRRFTSRTNASAEVKVYSNLGNVTLKLNGATIGTQTSAEKIFTWNIKLRPGSNLIAVSSIHNGITYNDVVVWTRGAPGAVTPSAISSGAFAAQPITPAPDREKPLSVDRAVSALS